MNNISVDSVSDDKASDDKASDDKASDDKASDDKASVKNRVSVNRLGVNKKAAWFIGAGLIVALILAGVVSNFASTSPDGLDAATLRGCTVDAQGHITGGSCIAQQADNHQGAGNVLGGYSVRGVGNRYLSTGLSGVAGVLLTFAIGAGVFWLVRRRGRRPAGASDGSEAG